MVNHASEPNVTIRTLKCGRGRPKFGQRDSIMRNTDRPVVGFEDGWAT